MTPAPEDAGIVLLVDDDDLVRRGVGRTITHAGFQVVQAESAEEALDQLRRQRVDVVLTDVHLPGISGVELLERVPRIQPSAVMLVFTGMGDIQIANASLERGAADYFEKPIENWSRFLTVLRRSVAFSRLQAENRQLRRGGELFGNTPSMRALRARIAQVAGSQAPVLIHGESGTGKELVARELHRLSERPGAFTAINCAAIPEALIESELFGHVKGAHSTALEDRRGLFRAAPGVGQGVACLLIHQDVAETIGKDVLDLLAMGGVEIHAEAGLPGPDSMQAATSEDWGKEYLDAIIAAKKVASIDEAIAHIRTYHSAHTDCIITEDDAAVAQFFAELDSAILMHNASTQFADGGEFGMGAEIGIATGKMHARGPVGATQLTSFKYLVRGDGTVRK